MKCFHAQVIHLSLMAFRRPSGPRHLDNGEKGSALGLYAGYLVRPKALPII